MCDNCRWTQVAAAIDRDLETRVVGHMALLLDHMAKIVRANQHVTAEQRDAIETALEPRSGAAS